MNTGHLLQRIPEHSRGTSVSRAENGLPDWTFAHGILSNSRADYFSVGLYATDAEHSLLLMEQRETALVMLAVCTLNGRESLLLSLRTEPGLIGLTNYSTTIQSTPSNYQRKHGGKSTPFIEVAMDPRSHGNVLYDGIQYDWGDHYLHKTKRFLIVELSSPPEAPEGFLWVPLDAAKELSLTAYAVTNDLRVAIPLLGAGEPRLETACHADKHADRHSEKQPAPRRLQLSPGMHDSRGTGILFFKTVSNTREVDSWVQPLLVPGSSLKIGLAFASTPSGRVYALERRTQPGLLGQRLWFPADSGAGSIARAVKTSAEGGRFWRYPIDIELIEVSPPRDINPNDGAGTCWMAEQDLSRLVTQPLQTSLELRMAWSLAHAGGIHAP